MPEQYIVIGTIAVGRDEPARGDVRIQAFDRDMPSLERRSGAAPQLLGEATADAEGRFQLTYTLDQFQSGDGMATFRRTREKSADLSFRVFDRDGQELTIKGLEALDRAYRPDQIIFNAPNPIEVTIVLEGPREPAGTSEYERLMALLAPVVQDVPLAELSDEDVAFLGNELGLEQQRDVQQRIEWLRRSALLGQEASLPIEAFYGWGRKDLPARFSELAAVPNKNLGAVLEKLSGLRADTLREALVAAIEERIIPAEMRARVDRLVQQLTRRGHAPLEVQARLLDEDTKSPLAGYSVTTFDTDAGGQNLGLDITDPNGGFVFTSDQPRAVPAGAPPRLFSFRVVTPGGEALPDGPPTAVPPGRLGHGVLRVPVTVARPPASSLEAQLQSVKLPASPAVLTWLKANGVASFADIRRKGGLSSVADRPAADAVLIRRLDALADLDRLVPSARVSTVLVDKGYDSVLAIAGAPRSEFISRVGDDQTPLTLTEAAGLHVMATAQTELLNNILLRMAADKANGFALPASPESLVEGDQ